MRKKVDSYLGFAAKSRNLISGYHTCLHSIKQRKMKLLILSEDLSENTIDKLVKLSKENGIPSRIYGKSVELSRATGNQGRGVFGITDKNFADIILKEIDQ